MVKEYRITQADLDSIFRDLLTDSVSVGPHMYKDAYESGREDGIRHFHKAVEENAEIVIE